MSNENLDNIFRKLSKEITGSDKLSSLSKLKDVINSVSKKFDYTLADYSAITSSLIKATDFERKIQQDIANLQPDTNRLLRYREYEYITNRITYVNRGMLVLTQNILSPDDITKLMFDIDGEDKKVGYKLIEEYNLDINALNIIFKTLQLGDFFVEIVVEETYKNHLKALTEFEDGRRANIRLTSAVSNNSPFRKQNKSSPVKLKYHHPASVVVLGFDDIVLGYLVFPHLTDAKIFVSSVNMKNAMQIQLYPLMNIATEEFNSDSGARKRIMDLSKNILKTILKHNYDESKLNLTKNEISDIMLTLMMNVERDSDIEVRFVPADRMVHFKLIPSDFSPYGQSKLTGLEFPARNLIAIENSIIYYRLTRSVDRKIYYVEVGKTKDVQDKIQSFIRTLKRQRINLEELAIDEMSSRIAQFEDIFAPMRDGKRFIEADTLGSNNITISMEDWKEMRDLLVAGLEIPPAYLGIEQNYETRGTLSQENMVFAVTVLSYQRIFRRYFRELLRKISRYKYGKEHDIDVKFRPPIKLLLEKYSEMFQSFASMKDVLDAVGIPPTIMFEKYFGELLDDKEKRQASLDRMKTTIMGDQQNQMTGGM